jgi:hypothetical protein
VPVTSALPRQPDITLSLGMSQTCHERKSQLSFDHLGNACGLSRSTAAM